VAVARLWAAFDFPRHPLARDDGERVRGAFFAPPTRWLVARQANELAGIIDAAHQASRDGAWVLGGLRYEAAGALESALATHEADAALAEFAVYEQAPEPWPAPAEGGTLCSDWRDESGEDHERAAIERIREWIRSGDCYQVNLTTRLHAELLAEDLSDYFLALHQQQSGGFSLYLRLADGAAVASVSPELFFDWRPVPDAARSWLLAAQPMKGTAPRGRNVVADEAAQAHLRTSEKERAENLMIVDLLRNDLSRIATLGSVRVPRLFELHALPTVWQMTSTISAVSRPQLKLSEVFAALFPCGSVTGAPKVRAMQIIRALEPQPRGWYCGALGLMQPGGVASFNVPIRTVQSQGVPTLSCGVGSAITLDSQSGAELAEWRDKTRFLLRAQAPIAALETLRLQDGEFSRLAGHLARLQRTAQHFGLRLQLSAVRAALASVAQAQPLGAWRVRLTVDGQGQVQLQCQVLPETPALVQLSLAGQPIVSRGAGAEFLQHKTTRRELYQPFVDAKPVGAFDVLLWNEDGELTECSFGNIALQIAGRWLTPPCEAGLLPGVYREELLLQGRLHTARLLKADLARAEGLAFINSLRGWIPAELIDRSAADA